MTDSDCPPTVAPEGALPVTLFGFEGDGPVKGEGNVDSVLEEKALAKRRG